MNHDDVRDFSGASQRCKGEKLKFGLDWKSLATEESTDFAKLGGNGRSGWLLIRAILEDNSGPSEGSMWSEERRS